MRQPRGWKRRRRVQERRARIEQEEAQGEVLSTIDESVDDQEEGESEDHTGTTTPQEDVEVGSVLSTSMDAAPTIEDTG